MAWESSNRRSRLPGNWSHIRRLVIRRDGGVCQAVLEDTGKRCGEYGTDVDHIIRGDNHDLSNLQLLCRWHHKRKTQAEAVAARKPPPRTHRGRDIEPPPFPW